MKIKYKNSKKYDKLSSMNNTFEKKLKLNIFGESHGPNVGISMSGVPKGTIIDSSILTNLLMRRKSSGKAYTTPRIEDDLPIIEGCEKSGDDYVVTDDVITATFPNRNTHPKDYSLFNSVPRPSHADYTMMAKYGMGNLPTGGGQFSGRLTLPICFAGAVAMSVLNKQGISVRSHIYSIGNIKDTPYSLTAPDERMWTPGEFPVLDSAKAAAIEEYLNDVAKNGDSVGGIIECAITGINPGIGEPFFDSIESMLSHGMFSIPAVKGIEFGSGFEGVSHLGSEQNDPFILADNGEVITASNNSGGINGGISNGMPIVFRVAVKPTASISKPQQTLNIVTKKPETLIVPGRHDSCIVVRAVPVVEAMAAIILYNFYL